jgi:hypothetical protein
MQNQSVIQPQAAKSNVLDVIGCVSCSMNNSVRESRVCPENYRNS